MIALPVSPLSLGMQTFSGFMSLSGVFLPFVTPISWNLNMLPLAGSMKSKAHDPKPNSLGN